MACTTAGDGVPASRDEVTVWLQSALAGDAAAMDRVMQQMYAALRQLARQQLSGEFQPRTLSATELVSESFLRLFGSGATPRIEDRRHLLGMAARAMRQVLIDAARRRKAAKRPAAEDRIALTEIVDSLAGGAEPEELGRVLDQLETVDPRQARIVELKFFVGLGEAEIATLLGLSVATVQREWRIARAWLKRELGPAEDVAADRGRDNRAGGDRSPHADR
ncbi:sigma-70 family RNA polymerase sigma factor [Luteimonas sp. BDR2-5]|uniref:ECF-type sigma factor n=1 Tax=Proluteimonas luteida TaxID=2878685 RepID=UPI001E411FEC|nr:ECF-type sigma factor [Luteimonas sp. BDR2-5]MCD9027866.1 sigma-70 family RNA polymerase sigma factor [Luteimonas sp. BDR2-5]